MKLTRVHWHSVCLAVYLLVTVFDFVVFPLWTEYLNANPSSAKLVELSLKFQDTPTQLAVFNALNKQEVWQPLTLQQNGMFHMAFAAVLGIGAWKRTRRDGDLPDIPNDNQNNG